MNIVELKNVSYRRNNQVILDKVNVAITKGNIISIIGPNGSGKSSIAKLICRIWTPTSGKINSSKNIKIGYVPQKFAIDKFFPINVEYFLKINNLSESSYRPLLLIFNLERKLDTQLSSLSGGEMQRLLLVTALACNPDLLVLDEPTQYLDIDGQIELYKIIEDFARNRNISVLMISHDLYMVMKSSDHVICLNHHICCEGSAGDVQANSNFHHLYGNKLFDFIAPYAHHHTHTHGL